MAGDCSWLQSQPGQQDRSKGLGDLRLNPTRRPWGLSLHSGMTEVAFVSPNYTKLQTRGQDRWREEIEEVVSGCVLILAQ